MEKSKRSFRESGESKSKLLRLSFDDDISTDILPLNSVDPSPAMEGHSDTISRLQTSIRLFEDISTTEILPLNYVYPSPATGKSNPLCYRKSNQVPSDDNKSRLLQTSICLGEDIYTEILLRLPVKSILKFKIVSKLWLSIVSNHRFRQTHASRQSRAVTDLFFKYNPSCFFKVLSIDRQSKPEVSCFVPRLNYDGTLTCTSSCNGLQLLKSSNKHSSQYYIYNPTTDESKLLDLPPRITKSKYVCASLAFDPCESLHTEIVYKIIFLCREENYSSKFNLEVYSSTTGTCQTPVINTLFGNFDYENRGFYCNGSIHWLSSNAFSMASSNVHTECMNKIQSPWWLGCVHYFGESQGHLHLVLSKHRYFYRSSVLYVNELKRDCSGWFRKYKVALASIISAFPCKTPKNYGTSNGIVQDEKKNGNDRYGNFVSINPDEKEDGNDYCGTFMSIIRDEKEDGDDSAIVLVACGEWVEYNFRRRQQRGYVNLCNQIHAPLFLPGRIGSAHINLYRLSLAYD